MVVSIIIVMSYTVILILKTSLSIIITMKVAKFRACVSSTTGSINIIPLP